MKKIFLLLILCLISVSVFAKVNVTSVKLDESSISIDINETETLEATVLPKNATNKAVTWKSSNTSVATVSTTGVVTGKKKGSCYITVTTKDQNKTAKCKVTVSSIICPTKVTLNKTSATLKVGETFQLKATVLPSNATDKSVEWESSNKSVATVSSKGLVKGIKAGTAKIEVETEKGDKKAYCSVTVVQPVTGVKLNKSSVSLEVGKTTTLTATVSPSNATNKTVTWKSSDTSVATVSSKGVVTGKKKGSCNITVTTSDGNKTAKCQVNVAGVVPTKVTLNKTGASIGVGKTVQLKATVSPADATDKTVSWSSSDTSVATVSSNGLVKGIKGGKIKITAITNSGSKKAACTITVIQSVTSVSVSPSSLTLTKGNTTTLTATVLPSTATNKNVIWSSSNTSVATVDTNGKVTAKGIGSAKIYVVTEDGSKKATCNISVISMGKANIKVLRGNKPITGLNVVIKNSSNKYSADTNSSGVASFINVLPGSYSIYIKGDKEGSINVLADETASATITLEEKTITFMFYANSYNLDNGLYSNLKQMYKYGSTDKVNIIVFYKSSTSNGVYKGKIVKSDGTNLSYGLAKIADKNFGDPDTLEDFCKWAMTTYPADEYILNLWNHGSGWTPYWDTRAINHEQDYDDDCLEIWELHDVVKDLDIDAICMDACIMQMMEVLTILKDDFDICMASENVIPGSGYNYTNLFTGLNDCSTIKDAFKYFAKLQMEDSYWSTYDTDIQITDLSKIEDVNKSILKISNYLVDGSYGDEIASARLNVSTLQHFSKDLGTFLYYLKNKINKSNFNTLVTAYETAKNNALIYNGERDEITGFAVNLPNDIQYGKYFDDYSKTDFAKATNWDKVLGLQ